MTERMVLPMMNPNRMYLDMHVLQTVPPSCVNRDDTGSPKTAIYGGALRARVSSQCWKHAMRLMFAELLPKDALGVRTKMVVDMLAGEIRKLGQDHKPEALAKKVLNAAGVKTSEDKKTKKEKTGALFFLSHAQARALAELAVAGQELSDSELKPRAQAALHENPGVDVALFGRMVADDPSLNTDACAQVAHSISTHRIVNEFDYFTAVDDLSPEDNAGAGHIGQVEFNSSTLYRYATVAVHELQRHLGDGTQAALTAFIRAFVCSMPTGKQNTFANRTLPDAVLICLRQDQPLNLVGAFERPVPQSDEGYVSASVERLASHAARLYADFAGEPLLQLAIGRFSAPAQPVSLDQAIEQVNGMLDARLQGGERP